MCWIAPEMPAARYSFGATVLPVWPIWPAYGNQPASTTARVAATPLAAERVGQVLGELEALGLAQAAAAGDQHVGALDVDVGAALLAALDHRRLVEKCGELERELLDRRRAAAVLGDLERVEAADDDPDGLRKLISEIAESPRIGRSAMSLPPSAPHRGDLHRDARVQARGQAGADLEAEQAAAEQRVVVAAVRDRRGHRVDDGLRETLGTLARSTFAAP